MKRLLALLVFIGLFSSYSFAQDTLTKAADYSIFPIGVLRSPESDTLVKMIGSNFLLWSFGNSPSAGTLPLHQIAKNVLDSAHALKNPLDYRWGTDSCSTDSNMIDLLHQSAYGVDIRVYMPGTSGNTNEYSYRWRTNKGEASSSHQGEWLFKTDSVSSGDYVLSQLDNSDPFGHDATEEPFTPDAKGNSVVNGYYVKNHSYESVVFFDSLALTTVLPTTPLYSVEYWNMAADTMIAADTITKTKYNTLDTATTFAIGHPGVTAERLCQWKGNQNLSRKYRLLKRIIDTRKYYTIDTSTINSVPRIEVRVKTFDQIPMYFRCLRIRDWRAQQLLSGKADKSLKSAITQLLSHPANKAFKSWTIGNENNYKTFHAWGYVNNLMIHNGAPPANILAPYQTDLSLRVLRDQTSYDKASLQNGLLWHEWTTFGGIGWFSRWGDTVYFTATNVTDFNYFKTRALPSAVVTDALHDSVYLRKHGILAYGDYGAFTSQIQDTMLGYSSEASSGGNADYQKLLRISQSSYEADPTHPVPYYVMAQTLVKPVSVPKWSVDSLFIHRRDSIHRYRETIPSLNGLR